MRRFLGAMALACILSTPVWAGDVPSDGFAAPPPAGTAQTTSAPSPGDIPSGGAAQSVSSTALSLIQALIGLLAI